MRMKNWNMKSIRQKLTIVFVVALLIPYLAIGIFVYSAEKKNVEKEIINGINGRIQDIKSEIQLRFQSVEAILNTVVQNTHLYSILSEPDMMDYVWLEGYETEYKNIAHIASNYPNTFRRIFIISNDVNWHEKGIHFFNAQNIWKKNDALIDLKTNDNGISYQFGRALKLIASDKFSEYCLYAEHSIYSVSKKEIAKLYIEIPMSMLVTPNSEYEFDFFDQNMNLIYTSETDVQRNDLLNKDGSHVYGILDAEQIGIVIKVINKDGGMSLEKGMLKDYTIISSSVLLVIALVSCFILNPLIRRINNIMNKINIISNGQYDIRLDVPIRDELGVMALAINNLLTRISLMAHDKTDAYNNQKMLLFQQQINPHFIYNTMDYFQMRVERCGGHDTAEKMINFCKILHYSMEGSCFSTLKQEISIIEKYVEIYSYRKEITFSMKANIDNKLKNMSIPKLTLQPIVENSIKYGFISGVDRTEFRLQISASERNGIVYFEIEDNGRGIEQEKLDEINRRLMNQESAPHNGIGLTNVQSRLKLCYGEKCRLQVSSTVNQYTKVTIIIPYNVESGKANDKDIDS